MDFSLPRFPQFTFVLPGLFYKCGFHKCTLLLEECITLHETHPTQTCHVIAFMKVQKPAINYTFYCSCGQSYFRPNPQPVTFLISFSLITSCLRPAGSPCASSYTHFCHIQCLGSFENIPTTCLINYSPYNADVIKCFVIFLFTFDVQHE